MTIYSLDVLLFLFGTSLLFHIQFYLLLPDLYTDFSRSIDLDYRDIECFALEMNRDHSVIFEIASKYCTLDSFVDHDGYSISPKEFHPQ